MKDLLIVATGVLVSLMGIGSFYIEDSLFQWAVATSIEFQIARVLVVAMLIGLLISKPPRSLWFRLSLFGVALISGTVAPILAVMDSLPPLDAIIAMEIAVIFTIEALEAQPSKVLAKTKVKSKSKPKHRATAAA